MQDKDEVRCMSCYSAIMFFALRSGRCLTGFGFDDLTREQPTLDQQHSEPFDARYLECLKPYEDRTWSTHSH